MRLVKITDGKEGIAMQFNTIGRERKGSMGGGSSSSSTTPGGWFSSLRRMPKRKSASKTNLAAKSEWDLSNRHFYYSRAVVGNIN